MTSAGELGVVLSFLSQCYTVSTVQDLARLIVTSSQEFGLETSVQIRTDKGVFNASTVEPISQLELTLLMRLKDAGRLKEKDNKLVANFGDITQLIKNMPEDSDKRGRYRDHIAILLEGAEMRLKALNAQHLVSQVIVDTREALAEIQQTHSMQQENSVAILDRVLADLEGAFLSYGLTEEQEEALLEIVRHGIDKSLDNRDANQKVDAEFEKIIAKLESCAKF